MECNLTLTTVEGMSMEEKYCHIRRLRRRATVRVVECYIVADGNGRHCMVFPELKGVFIQLLSEVPKISRTKPLSHMLNRIITQCF